MRFHRSLLACLLLLSPAALFSGTISLVTGTPGDNTSATPTGPSPNLGEILLNFSNLTPFTTSDSFTEDGVTIASTDGLTVYPYSTQNPANPPNELYDDGANGSDDGSADLTISTDFATSFIGVGITDSDTDPPFTSVPPAQPIVIELQPLGAGGTDLGSPFYVQIPPDALGNSDGYFVVEDTTPGLYGLQITQPIGDPGVFGGLAITDVQVAPEPASFPLMAGAIAAMLGLAWRRRKQA